MKRKHHVTVPLIVRVLFILILSQPVLSLSSPVPPMEVPPNGSNVRATVVGLNVFEPGSLDVTDTSLAKDKPVYSLKLQIITSSALHTGLETFIVPGKSYEAFSYEVLDARYVGKTIEARLILKGTTQHVRWWVSNIRLGDEP